MKPTIDYYDITPDLATQWLTHNNANRKLRLPTVHAYADDMTRGDWELTAESIKLDTYGNLLDGQHRLNAIIESGKTVTMAVVQGLDPHAQRRMDTGLARTASDMLHMDGITYHTETAAAARIAILIGKNGTVEGAQRRRVTHSEIEKFLTDNPTFVNSVASMCRRRAKIRCAKSILGYTAWKLIDIDYTDAQAFFDGLETLTHMEPLDPRIALTRRFQELYGTGRRDETIAAIFRAWNCYRHQEPLAFIRITRDRTNRVQIPLPV